jgi:integrase
MRMQKGDEAAHDAEKRFKRMVYDEPIGRRELSKLTPQDFKSWKKGLISGGMTKSSWNRNATALRAALNLALDDRMVSSNLAWRKDLRPFKDVDGRRELYLDREQRLSLLKNAQPDAQRFIKSLLLIPFRPGDVAKLKVTHFKPQERALVIPEGKTKKRTIPLSSEAFSHFTECAKDKLPGAWLVSRRNGAQWPSNGWANAINAAAAAARLPADTCAYSLRHAVITDLVRNGLDLFTVAKISGTSVSMIEKHYGHLQQEHAREALERLSL